MTKDEIIETLEKRGREACNAWIDDTIQSSQEGRDVRSIVRVLMDILSSDICNQQFELAGYSQEAILRIHRIACEGVVKGLQANEGKLGGEQ